VQVSLSEALESVRTPETILAWRAWTLSGKRDGSDLLLRPVAGRSRPWLPLKPAEAACKVGRMHAAPNVDCTCGLHGTHGLDILRRTKSPSVLGRVALWGRVVEHELGYRAEFAYPQRLALICYLCFWRWGAARSVPDVVGWYGWTHLVPLCREHLELSVRYGMIPRALLDAREVDQSLRSTYAVDPLAL
jgi:hypothetical protein